jgi:hypothetical protein
MCSLNIIALCSKSAILIGRANVKEDIHKISSKLFAATKFLGQILNFSNKKLPIAGKNKTGKGKKNLVRAVSKMAFFPASFDFPYVIVPSLFYTNIPSYNSFYLINTKLLAPAAAPAI